MEIYALLMFAIVVVVLLLGFPVAFTLGAVAIVFGWIFLGLDIFLALPLRIWGIMSNYTLLAVPLFVFMGVVLEKSGLAENLIESIGRAFGRMRGGLAIGTVLVGTLLAATTGVVGATVVTMGVIALPTMLKYRYSTPIACGTIAASGTLGQLVPPSVILILLGDVVGVSIGDLFLGALMPSLVLVGAFVAYLLVVAQRRPDLLPALERPADGQASMGALLRDILPPLLLVLAVLGSIFAGIASPTESAAVGCLGAILLAGVTRQFSLGKLREAAEQTTRLTSMVFMILIGATAFGLVFRGMGGNNLVQDLLTDLPGARGVFLAAAMLLVFGFGFFLDFIEICFVVVPILAPIAQALGIDLLWFSVLLAVNLQTSFLTPPFGFSLFYLKAVAPPEVRIGEIYRGVLPFVALQIGVLVLVIVFPGLVTWLPGLGAR